MFSSADKLLSVLSGVKKTLAMVLIGVLGLLVPLIVILYAAEFLVYGLPPSPMVGYSPLIVPVAGIIGITIALFLGVWRRTFTRKECFAVVALLVVSSALVVTVVKISEDARAKTSKSLADLDSKLLPITLIASQFDTVASREDMAADVAALVAASAKVHREYASELSRLLGEEKNRIDELTHRRDELNEGRAPERRRDLPQTWFDSVSKTFRQFWYSLAVDEAQAEWDRRYFAPQLQLTLLGHKLSAQPDENLATIRRDLATLAHAPLLRLIKRNVDSDEEVAALLRSTLLEHYLSPSPPKESPNDPARVRQRFRTFVQNSNAGLAIDLARADLNESAVTDIAILSSEAQLFEKVRDKFKELPGRAETARLAGKVELAQLLTVREMADLVFPSDQPAGQTFVTLTHRKWFLENAVPSFSAEPSPSVAEGGQTEEKTQTLETARALAVLAQLTQTTEEPGRLAFHFANPRDLPRNAQDTPAVNGDPTDAEIARAAGSRLARRVLDDFDRDHLEVLAFALDPAVNDRGEAMDPDERQTRLNQLEEVIAKNNDRNEQLQAFLGLERQLSVSELVTRVFPLAQEEERERRVVEPVRWSLSRWLEPKLTLSDSEHAALNLPCVTARAGCPYQWSDEYAYKVLLAAKALENDTASLARLARDELIDRALFGAAERKEILQALGLFPPELLGHDELAGIAVAKFWLRDSAAIDLDRARTVGRLLADELVSKVMFGVHGQLEQNGLATVKEQVTKAVMAPKVIVVSVFAVVIWLGCWITVDVNQTSIHELYRDRLATAFLVGRDKEGDIGIEEDVDLEEICRYEARSTAPYHLINVALNLQGSKDSGIRDRQSDFFIFSKRFIGGRRTGYCRSETMEQAFPQMSVASAMAISAAAASPNMGRGTSPLLVMFMTLLNIRLGYWMPNPGLLEERQDRSIWKPRRRNPKRAITPGFTFKEVFATELEEIEKRWGQVYPDGSRHRGSSRETNTETVEHGLVGIAFSGGGIRSAAFNLGVTQALHKHGVFDHVDYMSTVSGGGYLGSSISTLMRSREKLTSEIAGTVTIEHTKDRQIVTVTPREVGETQRTYQFAGYAALDVRDGENISAGRPLLLPRSARGRSKIQGTVTVEDESRIVRVQGVQPEERYQYRLSKWDKVLVKTGDTVKEGQPLIQRYDTLGGRFQWRVRPVAFLREMLSKLDETHRWVNLSDGGHIENLAAIELLRRRCKYIIIGDGEADPSLHFAGLATLMRCAYLDLGIEVHIDLAAVRLGRSEEDNDERAASRAHSALGTITYPGQGRNGQPEIGHLLYLKSSFTGDEHEVIREYRHRNPTFPHQTTADQAFEEDQFEAYRALGQHIAGGALQAPDGAIPAGTMSFADFEAWFPRLPERKPADRDAIVPRGITEPTRV